MTLVRTVRLKVCDSTDGGNDFANARARYGVQRKIGTDINDTARHKPRVEFSENPVSPRRTLRCNCDITKSRSVTSF